MLPTILPIIIILLGLMGSGCATIKAEPSKGAGFVPMAQMAKLPDLPFQKSWVKDGMDWKRYRTIYIAKVDTDHLLEPESWAQNYRREHVMADRQMIGDYMEEQFKEAFKNDPKQSLRVASSPEPGSMTLELALTELVPSNVLLEILGYGPYGSGVATRVGSRAAGAVTTVAFEAKVKDSMTGEILAMFADREQQKIKPIDLKALTVYGNAKSIITEWAEQFVEVANKRPGERIEESGSFTWQPW